MKRSSPRVSSVVLPARGSRTEQRIDFGWRFHRGEVPGAFQPDCDDSGWTAVDLPHDFALDDLPGTHSPFDPEAEGGPSTGYVPGAIGWYRKLFKLPRSAAGRRVVVEFDGVYKSATVWINGVELGHHPYGYTAFSLDLTDHVTFDGPNVLAVRVDTTGKHTRWYSGAGIYRHVSLIVSAPNRFDRGSLFVWTSQLSAERAQIRAAAAAIRLDGATEALRWRATILGPSGEQVASIESELGEVGLTVSSPEPWSPDSPSLYGLIAELLVNGRTVDRIELTFGIRSIAFSAAEGFLLNGVPTKLRGGCVHHDLGLLGSAAHDRAEERRVEVLKAAGYNAVRTSHNPPSTAFLDACDRLGLLVMDEAFDMWQAEKNPQDYHLAFDAWWERDIESMVLRDRNHPSVILWSIGNEIIERFKPEGHETARRLADKVRRLDRTRPVTAAICGSWETPPMPWPESDPAFEVLDVGGYNYLWGEYAGDRVRHPERVIVGTESFPKEAFDNWNAVMSDPGAVGDFVWTALDYIGEAGIGRVSYPNESEEFGAPYPWTIAGCGDIDICGEPKPQSVYRSILWGTGPKVACYVDAVAAGDPEYKITAWGWPDECASWTWSGTEGRIRTVRVYTACPSVRLFLNGRDLGVVAAGPKARNTATFSVPYEPGELTAVALDESGAEAGRTALRTCGKPAALQLKPDRTRIAADGADLCFVAVDLVDASGLRCPNADRLVRFKLKGAGAIVAVGSGDPRSVESFRRLRRTTFHGRAWVVVRASRRAGPVVLTASATGIGSAVASILVGS